jgi:hypothetical protein
MFLTILGLRKLRAILQGTLQCAGCHKLCATNDCTKGPVHQCRQELAFMGRC